MMGLKDMSRRSINPLTSCLVFGSFYASHTWIIREQCLTIYQQKTHWYLCHNVFVFQIYAKKLRAITIIDGAGFLVVNYYYLFGKATNCFNILDRFHVDNIRTLRFVTTLKIERGRPSTLCSVSSNTILPISSQL